MSEKLINRIRAVNETNAFAYEVYTILVPLLTPFVGKKVLKSDGTLQKSVNEALKDKPSHSNIRTWWERSNYSMDLRISGRGYDFSFRIGNVTDQILTGISTFHKERTDYTVEEILNTRKMLSEAKRVVHQLQSDLNAFGEYDV